MFSDWMRRALFEARYLFGRPRWDTGITPPELVQLVEAEHLPPGRALDIGCGTGTNVIYLTQHGFKATGIDFVPRAIKQARDKARGANVRAEFLVADVLAPRAFGAPFDFVLDIGCFHTFAGAARTSYVDNLVRWTHSGSHYLVYAFFPRVNGAHRFGLSPEEMSDSLGSCFRLQSSTVDPNRTDRDSAWYHWVRDDRV